MHINDYCYCRSNNKTTFEVCNIDYLNYRKGLSEKISLRRIITPKGYLVELCILLFIAFVAVTITVIRIIILTGINAGCTGIPKYSSCSFNFFLNLNPSVFCFWVVHPVFALIPVEQRFVAVHASGNSFRTLWINVIPAADSSNGFFYIFDKCISALNCTVWIVFF